MTTSDHKTGSGDGGPAFPHLHNTCQRVNESEHHEGLSMRDYFAAAAMPALIAHFLEDGNPMGKNDVATHAYWFADTMLEVRAKTTGGQP